MDPSHGAPRHVRSITPYQPGKPITELARELGLAPSGIIKLASNENPLGMSPRAREAMVGCCNEIGRYPDGNGRWWAAATRSAAIRTATASS